MSKTPVFDWIMCWLNNVHSCLQCVLKMSTNNLTLKSVVCEHSVKPSQGCQTETTRHVSLVGFKVIHYQVGCLVTIRISPRKRYWWPFHNTSIFWCVLDVSMTMIVLIFAGILFNVGDLTVAMWHPGQKSETRNNPYSFQGFFILHSTIDSWVQHPETVRQHGRRSVFAHD